MSSHSWSVAGVEGGRFSHEEIIILVSAQCDSAVQCKAVHNLQISVEEETARGQVRAVQWPVFLFPSPAGEDPGTEDAIDYGHGSIGSATMAAAAERVEA